MTYSNIPPTATPSLYFNQMYDSATNLLKNQNDSLMQTTILRTENKQLYALSDELDQNADDLVPSLNLHRADTIQFVLCVFTGGQIDLPSFRFRNKFIEFNPQNANAYIFVLRHGAVSTIRLRDSTI